MNEQEVDRQEQQINVPVQQHYKPQYLHWVHYVHRCFLPDMTSAHFRLPYDRWTHVKCAQDEIRRSRLRHFRACGVCALRACLRQSVIKLPIMGQLPLPAKCVTCTVRMGSVRHLVNMKRGDWSMLCYALLLYRRMYETDFGPTLVVKS